MMPTKRRKTSTNQMDSRKDAKVTFLDALYYSNIVDLAMCICYLQKYGNMNFNLEKDTLYRAVKIFQAAKLDPNEEDVIVTISKHLKLELNIEAWEESYNATKFEYDYYKPLPKRGHIITLPNVTFVEFLYFSNFLEICVETHQLTLDNKKIQSNLDYLYEKYEEYSEDPFEFRSKYLTVNKRVTIDRSKLFQGEKSQNIIISSLQVDLKTFCKGTNIEEIVNKYCVQFITNYNLYNVASLIPILQKLLLENIFERFQKNPTNLDNLFKQHHDCNIEINLDYPNEKCENPFFLVDAKLTRKSPMYLNIDEFYELTNLRTAQMIMWNSTGQLIHLKLDERAEEVERRMNYLIRLYEIQPEFVELFFRFFNVKFEDSISLREILHSKIERNELLDSSDEKVVQNKFSPNTTTIQIIEDIHLRPDETLQCAAPVTVEPVVSSIIPQESVVDEITEKPLIVHENSTSAKSQPNYQLFEIGVMEIDFTEFLTSTNIKEILIALIQKNNYPIDPNSETLEAMALKAFHLYASDPSLIPDCLIYVELELPLRLESDSDSEDETELAPAIIPNNSSSHINVEDLKSRESSNTDLSIDTAIQIPLRQSIHTAVVHNLPSDETQISNIAQTEIGNVQANSQSMDNNEGNIEAIDATDTLIQLKIEQNYNNETEMSTESDVVYITHNTSIYEISSDSSINDGLEDINLLDNISNKMLDNGDNEISNESERQNENAGDDFVEESQIPLSNVTLIVPPHKMKPLLDHVCNKQSKIPTADQEKYQNPRFKNWQIYNKLRYLHSFINNGVHSIEAGVVSQESPSIIIKITDLETIHHLFDMNENEFIAFIRILKAVGNFTYDCSNLTVYDTNDKNLITIAKRMLDLCCQVRHPLKPIKLKNN